MGVHRFDFPKTPWCCSHSLVGEVAQAVYCLIWIKGDWAEYATTLGFPSWTSAVRPCFNCNCSLLDMFKLRGIGPFNFPHRPNEDSDYFEACNRCEVEVIITSAEEHNRMCKILFYDKREQGSKGLALRENFDALGLIAGDRLDPTPQLRDVGGIFHIAEFPRSVKFWRVSLEYLCRHRNPLFDESLGITPSRSLTADILHCVYLGIILRLCRIILWMLILSGVLASVALSLDMLVRTSVLALQNQLSAWYKRRHKAYPAEKLTRYHLRESKVGTRHEPAFKAKAAEAYGFMLFLLDLLDRVHLRLPDPRRAKRLLRAGRALEELLRIWRHAKPRLSAEEIARSWKCFQEFMVATDGESECEIPKRHMLYHILEKIPIMGNPRSYANWTDETLGKNLKQSCRHASQRNFEVGLLRRMREWLRRWLAKRPRESSN
jgi:hypothetical protein